MIQGICLQKYLGDWKLSKILISQRHYFPGVENDDGARDYFEETSWSDLLRQTPSGYFAGSRKWSLGSWRRSRAWRRILVRFKYDTAKTRSSDEMEHLNPNRYSGFNSYSFDGFMQVPSRSFGGRSDFDSLFHPSPPITRRTEERPHVSPQAERILSNFQARVQRGARSQEMRKQGVLKNQSQNFSGVSNDHVLTDLFTY